MEGRKGACLIKICAVLKRKHEVDEFDKIKQETKTNQLVPALLGPDFQMVRAGKRVRHSYSQMVERRPHTPHTTGHITLRGTAPDTRQPHTDTHERVMLCLGMTEGGPGRPAEKRAPGRRTAGDGGEAEVELGAETDRVDREAGRHTVSGSGGSPR